MSKSMTNKENRKLPTCILIAQMTLCLNLIGEAKSLPEINARAMDENIDNHGPAFLKLIGQDMSLNVTPLITFNTPEAFDCLGYCRYYNQCRAINVKCLSGDTYRCEVLGQDQTSDPEKLIPTLSSSYYDLDVDKCKPCARIIADYTEMGYFCDCLNIYEPEYDCREHQSKDRRISGLYKINIPPNIVNVFCDMEFDHGGWTIIQRRWHGTTFFNRTWAEYKEGFGDIKRDFWVGNENIKTLTIGPVMFESVFMVESFDGETAWAKYNKFRILSERKKYRLEITFDQSRNIEDELTSSANDMRFSTTDDFDSTSPNTYQSGWWYNADCHKVNLNGQHLSSGCDSKHGMVWFRWPKESIEYSCLRRTIIMIRSTSSRYG